MNTLIIGGSRGIGWELAKIYAAEGATVTVTGRKHPDEKNAAIIFRELDLSSADYADSIRECIKEVGRIERFIYSPGYFQEGRITDLSEEEILDMVQVCGTGCILAARDILLGQDNLPECIIVTSSSQWTPRELEPIYNFAKAGVGHFAAALSLDARVGKLLVAGPTGTKTAFHANREGVDMSTYHDPAWVAKQIYDHVKDNFEYKFIKILRDPAKVEVSETR